MRRVRALGPWKRVWVKNRPGSKRPYRLTWVSMNPKSAGLRAIAWAKKDLGVTENPPGSNKQKFGEYWKENGVPWCGLAVAYWWKKAGLNVSPQLAWMIDYVPELVSLAKDKKYGLRIVRKDKAYPGVAVAFDFDGGVADHVGLFHSWINKRAGTFYAIEGNTSLGDNSNGGQVMKRERHISQVEAFVAKIK